MNWYRITSVHDQWTRQDVGRIVSLEGTIRNLMLVQAGYLEEIPELAPQPGPKDPTIGVPPVGTKSPTGRRRRGTAQTGSGPDEGVRAAAGDPARGEDVPSDRSGGETAGTGEETGSAA